eukprot:3673956-Rhodomonas_salina.3
MSTVRGYEQRTMNLCAVATTASSSALLSKTVPWSRPLSPTEPHPVGATAAGTESRPLGAAGSRAFCCVGWGAGLSEPSEMRRRACSSEICDCSSEISCSYCAQSWRSAALSELSRNACEISEDNVSVGA